MECFAAVSRKAKNVYEWKGLKQIGISISEMETKPEICFLEEESRFQEDSEEIREAGSETTLSQESSQFVGKKKREKSLGQLCLQFIGLFIRKSHELSLDQAASMLSSKVLDDKMKTKIRRLYDISNVLQALNLIEKTSLSNRKPGFKWLGYEGFKSYIPANKKNGKIIFKITREESHNCSYQNQKTFIQIPAAKHFKPKIIQSESEYNVKIGIKKRKLNELADMVIPKENINSINKQITKCGAFTKLNSLLEFVQRMDCQGK